MTNLKIFSTAYISALKKRLELDTASYTEASFDIDESQVLELSTIKTDYPALLLPQGNRLFNYENSKIMYEGYKLNPIQASDPRIWTYLTHVVYWDYMQKREHVSEVDMPKRATYIKTHWFIERVNPANMLRNNISLLWWVAHLTHEASRENPYELTHEAFTILDYTRHLLSGTQGRNITFTHALLEFVIENKDLFSNYKESKVRLLMRRSNYIAGYKHFSVLQKEDIKEIFSRYRKEISNVKSNN
jgi:hypothetical protein